jgi:hypothetical protein
VLVGLVAPALSPLATVLSSTDQSDPRRFGYRVIAYPPNGCLNIRRYIGFYTLFVPFNFITTAGITLLILIFWKLYKVSIEHCVHLH